MQITTGGMTAAQRATLAVFEDLYANANGPDGLGIFDAGGILSARIRPSYDTPDAINASVPPVGEPWVMSGNFAAGYGDGVTLGGLAANLNAENSLFVGATGTDPLENGTKLSDALSNAAARTPYGAALSNTNWMNVLLGPGDFDITGLGAALTVPNFVAIHGVCGSTATRITTTTSRRLQISQVADVLHYSRLRGLAFVSTTPGSSLLISFVGSAPTITIDWEDLDFPGLSEAQQCMAFGSLSGLSSPTIDGVARRIRTTGMGLLGGHGTAPTAGNFTLAAKCYDCEGGNRSFGGSSGTLGQRSGHVTGGLYNCRNLGDGVWDAILDADLADGSIWTPAIGRLGTSAYLRDSIVRGATNSLTHSTTIACRFRNMLFAAPVHSNVTNDLTGDAGLADATSDDAGNFVSSNA